MSGPSEVSARCSTSRARPDGHWRSSSETPRRKLQLRLRQVRAEDACRLPALSHSGSSFGQQALAADRDEGTRNLRGNDHPQVDETELGEELGKKLGEER
eukprot:511421-Hanusia_phi.AAC.1